LIHPSEVSAVILAGGRGQRMGGVDKGLQSFRGAPMAMHAVMRLQMQEWDSGASGVFEIMVNANRNLSAYESLGVPVWPDATDEFAGPLSGFLVGLERCETPYLLTVPCDSPLMPLNLAQQLADALAHNQAEIAMVSSPEPNAQGHMQQRAQPVFCLLRRELMESLVRFMHGGGRKIDAWTAQHNTVLVPFNDAQAFANANTLAELHALETQ
jgi:molybdenum cofactor guanylyltransferase